MLVTSAQRQYRSRRCHCHAGRQPKLESSVAGNRDVLSGVRPAQSCFIDMLSAMHFLDLSGKPICKRNSPSQLLGVHQLLFLSIRREAQVLQHCGGQSILRLPNSGRQARNAVQPAQEVLVP